MRFIGEDPTKLIAYVLLFLREVCLVCFLCTFRENLCLIKSYFDKILCRFEKNLEKCLDNASLPSQLRAIYVHSTD